MDKKTQNLELNPAGVGYLRTPAGLEKLSRRTLGAFDPSDENR